MFRFSQRYFEHQRSQEKLAEVHRAFEKERLLNRRWRRRNPNRKPEALLTLWNSVKLSSSKEYSTMMVEFMALFDGVSESNAMMRHGLEAADTEIPLDAFHDLAYNTFTLRMFEVLAKQCKLSDYTKELVLQKLVPQIFAPAMVKTNTSFAAETVSFKENSKG